MYIAKQKQTCRYKEQTSGYQCRGRREGEARQGYGINRHKILCIKINNQQGYIVQHRDIQPFFCNNFKWKNKNKNNESMCCTPETNIIL